MNFTIPLRNEQTGEEKNFHDRQAIADFLATAASPADWTGYQHLGPLPEPTVVTTAVEDAPDDNANGLATAELTALTTDQLPALDANLLGVVSSTEAAAVASISTEVANG